MWRLTVRFTLFDFSSPFPFCFLSHLFQHFSLFLGGFVYVCVLLLMIFNAKCTFVCIQLVSGVYVSEFVSKKLFWLWLHLSFPVFSFEIERCGFLKRDFFLYFLFSIPFLLLWKCATMLLYHDSIYFLVWLPNKSKKENLTITWYTSSILHK